MNKVITFTISAVIVIILFDIVAAIQKWGTISELISNVSYQYPIVPFIIGVICGHWFWPVKRNN